MRIAAVPIYADVSIGEETSEVQGKPVLTDAFTWIVDPIDVSSTYRPEVDIRGP